MKECTIIVKKVYETKKTRTVTERTVILSEDALTELCQLVCTQFYTGKETHLSLLYEALKGI